MSIEKLRRDVTDFGSDYPDCKNCDRTRILLALLDEHESLDEHNHRDYLVAGVDLYSKAQTLIESYGEKEGA